MEQTNGTEYDMALDPDRPADWVDVWVDNVPATALRSKLREMAKRMRGLRADNRHLREDRQRELQDRKAESDRLRRQCEQLSLANSSLTRGLDNAISARDTAESQRDEWRAEAARLRDELNVERARTDKARKVEAGAILELEKLRAFRAAVDKAYGASTTTVTYQYGGSVGMVDVPSRRRRPVYDPSGVC